ncbi:MAG: class II aldolase/adducin family protein [Thermosphaera sp.]
MYEDVKSKIVEAMKYMEEKSLNHGRSGNISVKVSDDKILITPSGVVKSRMKVEDILVVSPNGEILEGTLFPTVEMPMHLAIYKEFKHVGAVVHAHGLYSSVLAVSRESLPPIIEEMIMYTGGDVRVAEYAPFGSERLAKNVVEALRDRSAVLLANHGVVACGKTLEQALEVLTLVERVSQIYILAKIMGRVNVLPDDVVESQRAIFLRRIYESK